MIEAYNAAMSGAFSTARKHRMDIDRMDVEDAAAEAGLAALLKADFDRQYQAYGWLCGRSQAIKAGERNTANRERFRSIERFGICDAEGETEYAEYPVESDMRTDDIFIEQEEAEEKEAGNARFRELFGRLPEKDRVMYMMLADGKSYSDVAVVLGCTENSLYKRRKDGLARFSKLSAENPPRNVA